jgi:CRP-like cAMP-binding protein
MSKQALLRHVPLFSGLVGDELAALANICQAAEAAPGALLIEQNTTGSTMYVIAEGSVEVFIDGLTDQRTLVVLGPGQVVGEMALLDYGYRSASARATGDGCRFYAIERNDFIALCETDNHIGYLVMRNIAVDLAFKMRHRNLTEM